MNKHLEHNNLISRWLNGEISPEEKESLKESGELGELKNVIDDIDTWTVPNHDTEGRLLELKKQIESSKSETKIIQLRPFLKYAAAVAIFVLGYVGWNTYLSSGEIMIEAGIGETIDHELPDGSVVHIDATSWITYRKKNWKNTRSVRLKGQAYFDVEKGSTFIVTTNQGSVEVLGTEFNVFTSVNKFVVQCYEGKVNVESNGQNEKITAGEGVFLERNKLERNQFKILKPGWMVGHTVFDETPLAEVIIELKKYYNIEGDLPSEYQMLRFNGKMNHNDLDKALKTIFTPMEITYSLEDDVVVFE
jgi:ferric-dicitrate binding protein FerR (iron transport regulator)